jgi:ABC-type sugar transport system ATPase subunit
VSQPLIALENISKTFPGVAALRDVSFDIASGEVHALVGENGAGKSTLIKILSGVQQKDAGRILWAGEEAHIPNPKSAIALGISCIYQELPLARSLSVADNIFLGQELGACGLLNKARQNAAARDAFAEFGIQVNPRTPVGRLSVSMQQITAIIKSMMNEARLFIMDEPTAALGEHEVERLFDFIARLKKKNITVLYISHRLDEIFGIADRVTVLRDGRLIATRAVADIDRGELVAMMSGKSAHETAFVRAERAGAAAEPVFVVKDLRYGSLLNGVSLTLRRGEIFGITGLVGAGKTELLRCIYGLLQPTGGELREPGAGGRRRKGIATGSFLFGLVPEDRKREGLFLDLDIVKNISVSCLRLLTRLSWVIRKKETGLAEKSLRDLDIRARSITQKVKFLSGGNQQKVILSRWLSSGKKVLLLDEPTRGVDVVAKTEIYRLLDRLSAQGITILVSSCDVGEVLAVSDRVATLRGGKVVGVYERARFDKERVLHDILFDRETAEAPPREGERRDG